MDNAAAGAAYVDAAAGNDLCAGIHIAEDEHRSLALHLLTAAERAVHDEHLHSLLVRVRLHLCLSRLRLFLGEGDAQSAGGCRPAQSVRQIFLRARLFLPFAEVQAMLQEEFLEGEALFRREHPRAPLDDRAAPEEQGARFQLPANLSLDSGKLGLSHEHEQKPRLQPFEQYAFFLHDFLAFACACGACRTKDPRNNRCAWHAVISPCCNILYYIKISVAPPPLDERL